MGQGRGSRRASSAGQLCVVGAVHTQVRIVVVAAVRRQLAHFLHAAKKKDAHTQCSVAPSCCARTWDQNRWGQTDADAVEKPL
jgi:hypothetical protein